MQPESASSCGEYKMVKVKIRRKSFVFVVSLAIIFAAITFALASCTDFFTGSLAEWAARNPQNLVPDVTAGNVLDIIAEFENNPDASLVVLQRIRDGLSSVPPWDVPVLQASSLIAAVNSASMVTAVLSSVPNIDDIDEDNATEIIDKAISNMTNLESTSLLLYQIITSPGTPGFDTFAAFSDPDDLAFAAILLLSAEAKHAPGDLDSYVNDFPTKEKTPIENLALALAEAAVNHEDELGGPLGDILKGLNLI